MFEKQDKLFVSVRVSRITDPGKLAGQINHDLRKTVPSYAKDIPDREGRITLIKGSADVEEVKALIKEFFERTRKKRAAKSALGWEGIITFGADARAIFHTLSEEERKKYWKKAVEKIEEFTSAEVFYAVEHKDEESLHLHFMLAPKDKNGVSLSTGCFLKKESFSQLQEAVASAFQELGFRRGVKREELIKQGKAEIAKLRDNKSSTVRELRKSLELREALLGWQIKHMKTLLKEMIEKTDQMVKAVGNVKLEKEEDDLKRKMIKKLLGDGYLVISKKTWENFKKKVLNVANDKIKQIRELALQNFNNFVEEIKEKYSAYEQKIEENAELKKENARLKEEIERLEKLKRSLSVLVSENEKLKEENKKLKEKMKGRKNEITGGLEI